MNGWRGRAYNAWQGLSVALMMVCLTAAAQAQDKREVRAVAGKLTEVDKVACVTGIMPPTAAQPLPVGNRVALIVISESSQRERIEFTAQVSDKPASSGNCESAQPRHYVVTFDAPPEVSAGALETSFQVLVAAFVLALLLESAFALLFNWRPFNLMFVGRAVRTPIMLAAAWLVVDQFSFDLMARLFQAYAPGQTAGRSSWGSELLTAMILAGGSVGVNRILVGLGFRSQVRNVDAPPKLDDSQAWVAVEVDPEERGRKALVSVTEVVPAPGTSVSTSVGVAGAQRPSWRSVFRGDNYRVPRSGGMSVSTAKYYTITVQDLETGNVYDVNGRLLVNSAAPTILKFGPRAIMDFRMRLPK